MNCVVISNPSVDGPKNDASVGQGHDADVVALNGLHKGFDYTIAIK